MPHFLGRHVWLRGPHASHQVTLLLLSKMEKSINSAGIKGTDSIVVLVPAWAGPPELWPSAADVPKTHGCRSRIAEEMDTGWWELRGRELLMFDIFLKIAFYYPSLCRAWVITEMAGTAGRLLR